MFEIGNSLREARKRQQLDLTEVEQATKIRGRYLQALEEESFDVLPAQTYVKGFLRTYADYLGLDGQLYVDEFNSRYSVGEDVSREPLVARRASGVHSRHRRLERRGVLLALGGIAAVCGLVIAAFTFSGGGERQRIPNLGPTTSKTGPTVARKHKRAKPKRPAKLKFFVVGVGGSSWVEVRNYSSSGRTLWSGTVEPGHVYGWTARRLWINFGSPANLHASLNGKRVAIPTRGGTAFVLVTRSGLFPASSTG